MRPLLALVLATLLAAGPALAQTAASPIKGKYSELYLVGGRLIDSEGEPMRAARVVIELQQRGVTAEPLRATANCKGDFLADFNLRHVDPKGKVKVTILRADGSAGPSTTASLDPFFRRSDVLLQDDERWGAECREEVDVWAVSASLKARLLNRSERYVEADTEFFARPYTGILKMRYETPDGNTICPPHPQDQTGLVCEQFVPDERGDIKYTFTLDQPFQAGGVIELILQDNSTLRVDVDPESRLGVLNAEVTGQGVPEELYETPFAAAPVLALALALAVALRRRR